MNPATSPRPESQLLLELPTGPPRHALCAALRALGVPSADLAPAARNAALRRLAEHAAQARPFIDGRVSYRFTGLPGAGAAR